jgi:hypothetical protein
MAARPIDGAEGYALFLRHDGNIELDEINEYLRGIGMREVQPRMLQHYRKLQRYGYDSYITQNRLDLAVAGEYAWTEDMRAQYPELRQDVQAEIIHQGESSPASVERLGTASASIVMETPPPAGHHVVLRLPRTGIERLAVVTRTDRESGRCHLLFDTYSSLPVAPADSPYTAQLTFDLPDSSANVVAISDVMLRLERALTRLDRRGTEIVRVSRMRLASPLEIQLTGNELVDTFLKVATALVGLRLAWYQATKTKYEAEGTALDNEQKRRQAQQDADDDLVEAIEAEEDAFETPLLDQLETDEFTKGEPGSMTRRQFIEGLRAVIALPAEMRVTSSQPEAVDGER